MEGPIQPCSSGAGPQWSKGRLESHTSGKAVAEQPVKTRETTKVEAHDADDLLDEKYAALLRAGTHSVEQIEQLKARRRHEEELYVCKHMIKGKSWQSDPACTECGVYLCYAAALDGLNRIEEAIILLRGHQDPVCKLALAKLLFKEDHKEESLALCAEVYEAYVKGEVSEEDTADAYYLAGTTPIMPYPAVRRGLHWVWPCLSSITPSLVFVAFVWPRRARACP